jgi:hypothetical protein
MHFYLYYLFNSLELQERILHSADKIYGIHIKQCQNAWADKIDSKEQLSHIFKLSNLK